MPINDNTNQDDPKLKARQRLEELDVVGNNASLERVWGLLDRLENVPPEKMEIYAERIEKLRKRGVEDIGKYERLERTISSLPMGSTAADYRRSRLDVGLEFGNPADQRIEWASSDAAPGQRRRWVTVRDVLSRLNTSKVQVQYDVRDHRGDPVIRLRHIKNDGTPVYRDIKVVNGVVMIGNADSDSYNIVTSSVSTKVERQENNSGNKKIEPGDYRGVAQNLLAMAEDISGKTYAQYNYHDSRVKVDQKRRVLGPSGGSIRWDMSQSNPAHLAKRGIGALSIPATNAWNQKVEGVALNELIRYGERFRRENPLDDEPESNYTLANRKASDRAAFAVLETAVRSFPMGFDNLGKLATSHVKAIKHLLLTGGSRRYSGGLIREGREVPLTQALAGSEGREGVHQGSRATVAMFMNRIGFTEGAGYALRNRTMIADYKRSFIPGLKPEETGLRAGDVFTGKHFNLPSFIMQGGRFRGRVKGNIGMTTLPMGNNAEAHITNLAYNPEQMGTWADVTIGNPLYNAEYKEFNTKAQLQPVKSSNPFFSAIRKLSGGVNPDIVIPFADPGNRFAGQADMMWKYQAASNPDEVSEAERRASMISQFFAAGRSMEGIREEDLSTMLNVADKRGRLRGHIREAESGGYRVFGTQGEDLGELEEVLAREGLKVDISHRGTGVATKAATDYVLNNMQDVEVKGVTVPHWQMREVAFLRGMQQVFPDKGIDDLMKMTGRLSKSKRKEVQSAAQKWFQSAFTNAEFIRYDNPQNPEKRRKINFGQDETSGYWNVSYMDKAFIAHMGINPIANYGKGEATMKGEQLSVLRRFQPAIASMFENMDRMGLIKNSARDLLRATLANTEDTLEKKVATIKEATGRDVVDVRDLNFQGIVDEVRSELDPNGYTTSNSTDPREIMAKNLLDEKIKTEVLRRIDKQTKGASLSLDLGSHGSHIIARGKVAAANMTAFNRDDNDRDNVGYGTAAYDLLSHYFKARENKDENDIRDLLRQSRVFEKNNAFALQDKSLAAKSQEMKIKAFTGPVVGVQGLPGDMVVARTEDYRKLLKTVGITGEEFDRQMELFAKGEAVGTATMFPHANRFAAFYGQRIVPEEWVRKNFPGMGDKLVPEGGLLASPEFVASQAKDYDGDRIVAYLTNLTKDAVNWTRNIVKAGWRSRGQEMQGVIEKSMFDLAGYLKTMSKLKGMNAEKLGRQATEGAESQERMGLDFNAMVRNMTAPVDWAITRMTETGKMSAADAAVLSSAASHFGQDTYQLSLDMKKSEDPDNFIIEQLISDGVIHYGTFNQAGYGHSRGAQHFKIMSGVDPAGNNRGESKLNPEGGRFQYSRPQNWEALPPDHPNRQRSKRLFLNSASRQAMYDDFARNILKSMLFTHQQHRQAGAGTPLADARAESEKLYLGSGQTSTGEQFSPGIIEDHVKMLVPMGQVGNQAVVDKTKLLLRKLHADRYNPDIDWNRPETFNKLASEFLGAIGREVKPTDTKALNAAIRDYVFGRAGTGIEERSALALSLSSKIASNTLRLNRKEGYNDLNLEDLPGNMGREAFIGGATNEALNLTRMVKGVGFRESEKDKPAPHPILQIANAVKAVSGERMRGVFGGFETLIKNMGVTPRAKGGPRKRANIVGEEGIEVDMDADGFIVPYGVYQNLTAAAKKWVDQTEGVAVGAPGADTPMPEGLEASGKRGKYLKSDIQGAMARRQANKPRNASEQSSGSVMEQPYMPPTDYEALINEMPPDDFFYGDPMDIGVPNDPFAGTPFEMTAEEMKAAEEARNALPADQQAATAELQEMRRNYVMMQNSMAKLMATPEVERDSEWHNSMSELVQNMSANQSRRESILGAGFVDPMGDTMAQAQQTFSNHISKIVKGRGLPPEARGGFNAVAIATGGGLTIENRELKFDFISDKHADDLQRDLLAMNQMLAQAEERPELAESANFLKKMSEITGRISFTRGLLGRQREAFGDGKLHGDDDAIERIDAMLGNYDEGGSQRQHINRQIETARRMVREGAPILAEDLVERATPGIAAPDVDRMMGATREITKFTEAIAEMPDVLSASTKEQKMYMKQIQAAQETYSQMTKELGGLTAKARTKDGELDLSRLDDNERAMYDLLTSDENQQFMKVMGERQGQIGRDMETLRQRFALGEPLDDDVRQAGLMELLQRRGPGGRRARLDRANEHLYQGGLTLFSAFGRDFTLTDKNAINAFGSAMRGMSSLQSGLFAASMLRYNLGTPISGFVNQYQQGQMARQQALIQAGGITYDDAMQGTMGAVRRRSAQSALASEEIGEQFYRAYAPLFDFALSKEGAGAIGSTATALAPGLAAGMIGKSMFGGGAGLAIGALTTIGSTLLSAGQFSGDVSAQAEYILRGRKAIDGKEGIGRLLSGIGLVLSDIPSTIGFASSGGSETQEKGRALADLNERIKNNLKYGRGDEFSPTWDTYAEIGRKEYANAVVGQRLNEAPDLSLEERQRIWEQAYKSSASSVQAMMLDAVTEDASERGIDPEQALKYWQFSETYGKSRGGYFRNVGLFDQLEALKADGVFEIPQMGISAAASMGFTESSDQVFGMTQQLANYLTNLPEGVLRSQESLRVRNTIQRNTQVNPALVRAGMAQRGIDFYGHTSGVFADDANRQDALDRAYLLEAQTRTGNTWFGNYSDQFLQRQRDLIAEEKYRQAETEAISRSDAQALIGGYRTYNPNYDVAGAEAFFMEAGKRDDYDLIRSFLTGDRRAATEAAKRFGLGEQFRFLDDNGLGKFETHISDAEAAEVYNNDSASYYGWLRGGLPNTKYGRSIRGWQAEMRDIQRDQQRLSYDYGRDMTIMGGALQMSGIDILTPIQEVTTEFGKLGKVTPQVTKGLEQVSEVFAKYGFAFDAGDGRGIWQVQDAQRARQREQQQYSFDREEQDLDLRLREFDLAGKQFYEKIALNREQMQYGRQYQQNEMLIGRQQQLRQQQWSMEDWTFNRNRLDLGFAWSMEDFDRNIRYARGRERVDLMRQKNRAVIEQSMNVGRSDTELDRMKETNKWAEERYNRELAHHEKMYEFQEREMQMSIDHFEQDRALQLERILMTKDRFEKEKQWLQEQWADEDQLLLLERQTYALNLETGMAMQESTFKAQENMNVLNDAVTAVGLTIQDSNAKFDQMVAKGELWKQVADQIGISMETTGTAMKGMGDIATQTTASASMMMMQAGTGIMGTALTTSAALSMLAFAINNLKTAANLTGTPPPVTPPAPQTPPATDGTIPTPPMGNAPAAVRDDVDFTRQSSYNDRPISGDASVELLGQILNVLEDIRALGPGRVSATIYTTEKTVETSDIFDQVGTRR